MIFLTLGELRKQKCKSFLDSLSNLFAQEVLVEVHDSVSLLLFPRGRSELQAIQLLSGPVFALWPGVCWTLQVISSVHGKG